MDNDAICFGFADDLALVVGTADFLVENINTKAQIMKRRWKEWS